MIAPSAHLGRAPVAVFDDLGVVVAGIDVQQGKRKTAGTEGFFGQAQQADRILAAREEQGRVAALAGDFAQEVDGFRLEPVEVGEVGGGLLSQCGH